MFDFSKYENACVAAANDDNAFRVFRREHIFYDMYEHVTYEQGLVYLELIRQRPSVYARLSSFVLNDKIGSPKLYQYDELGYRVAPTTLRYVKVLADLMTLFGSLDDMNIVEIGGGYGGQCRVLYDMFNIKSYTLVDLPGVVPLAQRYLREFNIHIKGNEGPYDLFISNYAFTEIERGFQDAYKELFIDKSARGYMTCNFYDWKGSSDMMTFGELTSLVPGVQVHEEIPLTAKDNFILTWNNVT